MAESSGDDSFEAAAAPLSESELADVAPFGDERTVAAGDVVAVLRVDQEFHIVELTDGSEIPTAP